MTIQLIKISDNIDVINQNLAVILKEKNIYIKKNGSVFYLSVSNNDFYLTMHDDLERLKSNLKTLKDEKPFFEKLFLAIGILKMELKKIGA